MHRWAASPERYWRDRRNAETYSKEVSAIDWIYAFIVFFTVAKKTVQPYGYGQESEKRQCEGSARHGTLKGGGKEDICAPYDPPALAAGLEVVENKGRVDRDDCKHAPREEQVPVALAPIVNKGKALPP